VLYYKYTCSIVSLASVYFVNYGG